MDKVIFSILNSNLSKRNTKLDGNQTAAAVESMVDYSVRTIDMFKQNETKAANIEAIKLFPALIRGEIKMWYRKRAFLKAKKLAQQKADIEGRPVHVVRASEISYAIQSSKDVRNLKKAGVYKKSVNFKVMDETADFTAWPNKK